MLGSQKPPSGGGVVAEEEVALTRVHVPGAARQEAEPLGGDERKQGGAKNREGEEVMG